MYVRSGRWQSASVEAYVGRTLIRCVHNLMQTGCPERCRCNTQLKWHVRHYRTVSSRLRRKNVP